MEGVLVVVLDAGGRIRSACGQIGSLDWPKGQ
jgi:hypothetical protein